MHVQSNFEGTYFNKIHSVELGFSNWSRLLIHPRGVEGAHDFFGNSANTDLIRQAKGEPGQAPVPTPTLETNKNVISEMDTL